MKFRALIADRLVRRATNRPVRRTAGIGSARRAAAVAVLAGAATFALLHFGLSFAAARSKVISDPFYADKETRLAELDRAPLVLVLGSSRTLNGFAAERVGPVATATGTPAVAFNFGVPGAGPITQAVYLRRLLADGHTPTVLFLEVLPSLFADEPNRPPEANLLLADRLTWAETEFVIERYAFPAEIVRTRRSAADRWPWEVHRFKLMSRLEPDALPCELRLHAARSADTHGWLALMVNPGAFTHTAAQYGPSLADWNPGPAPTRALRDTLALCRARGIAVGLLLMPESSAFRALYPEPVRERLNAFLAGVCAEFGCPLIDAREWVDSAGFSDGHHLLRAGGVAFTDRLTTEAILPLLRQRRAP